MDIPVRITPEKQAAGAKGFSIGSSYRSRIVLRGPYDKGPVARASVWCPTRRLLQEGNFKSGGCNTIAARQSANDSPTTTAKTPAHIGVIP
jgi:hypothetical protein